LNRYFSKEVQMANKHMKNPQHIRNQGNANWNIIEISSHPSQNGNHEENKWQKSGEDAASGRISNPYTLLVGI
jgi:hypothetical protein